MVHLPLVLRVMIVFLLQASNTLEEKDAAMPLAYSPTHFLSYSWSMPLIDVKEVARTVTKELGDGWGLWFDVLTINQHQGDRTQADLAAVGECIARTGSLLFVVDARGTALSRVWCIYEIMTAVRPCAPLSTSPLPFSPPPFRPYSAHSSPSRVLSGRSIRLT